MVEKTEDITSSGKMRVKILFCMLDGLGDYHHPEIGCKKVANDKFVDKTPLQVAKIPYINAIAKTGLCGIHDPV